MRGKYPFKNLVFQGGGVKTFAYRGALEVLEKQGILPQIERVAGTSAGAMLATLVSFRLSVEETFRVFSTLEFARIPGLRTARDLLGETPEFIAPYLDRLTGNADALNRLVTRYGWYSTGYARTWIQETIAAYCDGNGLATFADFRARGFRDLYVVATNISQHTTAIFSALHTPDAPVAHALVLSQSIPLFFEALQFDGKDFGSGDFYADGGVLSNYPIHLFDDAPFQQASRWFMTGVNWETLGCRLYTPKDCITEARPITGFIQYIEHLLEATLEAQEVAYDDNRVDHQRTINISNCCVQATDFEVRPEAGNEQYAQLLTSGREAAEAFLGDYKLPTNQLWHWVRRNLLGR